MGVPSNDVLREEFKKCSHVPTLAEKFGCSANVIYGKLYRLGLREPAERHKIKDPDIELDGWTDDEIEGIAEAMISYAIKDYKRAVAKNDNGEIYSLERFFHSEMFSLVCNLVGYDIEDIVREHLKIE